MAHSNIALVKYWGKVPLQVSAAGKASVMVAAGGGQNLPATGSLSAGLEGLHTTTRLAIIDAPQDKVCFADPNNSQETDDQEGLHTGNRLAEIDASQDGTSIATHASNPATKDEVSFASQDKSQAADDNGLGNQAAKIRRVVHFLSVVRQVSGLDVRFEVETVNNFPTGAGLASSASGFAALALAADKLLELDLPSKELSRLARRGSGSAARSVFGGYAEMQPGEDAYACQLAEADAWPLDVVITLVSVEEKSRGSTNAMELSRKTSPYYSAWLGSHPVDMQAARDALAKHDFEQLAEVAEANCLKMHATAMTSSPPSFYWKPATLDIMHRVVELRNSGTPAFFTVDAGPQVKVFCEPGYGKQVAAALADTPGLLRVIVTSVGGNPEVKQLP